MKYFFSFEKMQKKNLKAFQQTVSMKYEKQKHQQKNVPLICICFLNEWMKEYNYRIRQQQQQQQQALKMKKNISNLKWIQEK